MQLPFNSLQMGPHWEEDCLTFLHTRWQEEACNTLQDREQYLCDIIVVSAQLLQGQPGLVGCDCANMLSMRPTLAVAELEEHLILALQPWQWVSRIRW